MTTGDEKPIDLQLSAGELDELIHALSSHREHLSKIYTRDRKVANEWKARVAELKALQTKLIEIAKTSRKGE